VQLIFQIQQEFKLNGKTNEANSKVNYMVHLIAQADETRAQLVHSSSEEHHMEKAKQEKLTEDKVTTFCREPSWRTFCWTSSPWSMSGSSPPSSPSTRTRRSVPAAATVGGGRPRWGTRRRRAARRCSPPWRLDAFVGGGEGREDADVREAVAGHKCRGWSPGCERKKLARA